MAAVKPSTIDEYIKSFPKEVQAMLKQIRQTLKKAIPGCEEKISYGIPTVTLDGHYVVYYAAHKKHIGLYPVPEGAKEFERDFAKYKTSGKGAIQFPLDEPMPLSLITKIARYRKREVIRKYSNNR